MEIHSFAHEGKNMSEQQAYEEVITRYMQALAACDLEGLSSLFTTDAQVYSPLLGWVEPRMFLRRCAVCPT